MQVFFNWQCCFYLAIGQHCQPLATYGHVAVATRQWPYTAVQRGCQGPLLNIQGMALEGLYDDAAVSGQDASYTAFSALPMPLHGAGRQSRVRPCTRCVIYATVLHFCDTLANGNLAIGQWRQGRLASRWVCNESRTP